MKTSTKYEDQTDDAGIVTQGLLMDMESFSAGDPERALIAGNSMLAAARLLLRRYGVDEGQRRALFEEYWKPLLMQAQAGL